MNLKRRTCSMLLAIMIIWSVCYPHLLSLVDAFGASAYVYGNTNSNLSNYGLVSEYNGKIYFANSADGNRLYTMKEDGTAYAKICDDEVQYINVINDVVYYVNLSENSSLYSVKIDGTGRTQISTDQCAYVNVVNTTIYYISITDGWKIKSCSLTGTNSKLLSSTVTAYNLNIVEGNAYYISLADGLIYRMVISSGAATAISSVQVHQMLVYEGYVFYIQASNSRVYRISASGSASQKGYNFTTYTCSHLAASNGLIYFSMNAKEGIIGSLEVDDIYTDTDVSAIYAACLNATDSYLYFSHIYEDNGNFIYYGDMHRITYDGKVTQSMTDVTAAGTVMAMIDALPAANVVTKEDTDNILQARQAYESLSEGQKTLVQTASLDKLTALEDAVELEGPSALISSTYSIDHANGIVTGFKQQTQVSAVAAAFSGNNGLGVVKIYDASGTEVTSGNVGTRYEVRLLYGDKTIESLQVVLLGDVNGDGRISAMDLLQVQKHLLKLITLQDAYSIAADVNGDGRISAMDLLQVQKHLLKMIVIA